MLSVIPPIGLFVIGVVVTGVAVWTVVCVVVVGSCWAGVPPGVNGFVTFPQAPGFPLGIPPVGKFVVCVVVVGSCWAGVPPGVNGFVTLTDAPETPLGDEPGLFEV